MLRPRITAQNRAQAKPVAQRSLLSGHSKWRALRRSILADEPLCRMCSAIGRVTAAVEVDHIVAVVDGGSDDRSNLQPLCVPCHDTKSARENRERVLGTASDQPILPASCDLTLVCGPPGAGKTTYVSAHACAHDTVIDLDLIICRMTGLPMYTGNRTLLEPAIAERNRMLHKLCVMPPQHHAWYVVAATYAQRQWWQKTLQPKHIVLLDPTLDVIVERIRKDVRRGERMHEHIVAAQRWYYAEVLERGELTQ